MTITPLSKVKINRFKTSNLQSSSDAPSLEEVQAYCDERNNNVDAQRFIDYYTANGWKVGRSPMKDWKATVRTWERQGYERKPIKGNNQHSVLDDMQELYNKYKAEEENEDI